MKYKQYTEYIKDAIDTECKTKMYRKQWKYKQLVEIMQECKKEAGKYNTIKNKRNIRILHSTLFFLPTKLTLSLFVSHVR